MRETNWVFSAADVERAQLEDCSASDEHCLHEGRDHYAEQVLSLASAQRGLLGRAYTDTNTAPTRGGTTMRSRSCRWPPAVQQRLYRVRDPVPYGPLRRGALQNTRPRALLSQMNTDARPPWSAQASVTPPREPSTWFTFHIITMTS